MTKITESTIEKFAIKFLGIWEKNRFYRKREAKYGKSLPTKALNEFSLTPQAQEIWDAIPGDFHFSFLIH